MDRIGNRLVAEGLIHVDQLDVALTTQRTEGGYVGQHLMDSGAVARTDFYAALARQWHLAVRDLVADPPDPALVAAVEPEASLEVGWVACELTDHGSVVVATAVRPAEELLAEVEEWFPGRAVEFVACTQRDLDGLALGARRDLAPGDEPDDVMSRPVRVGRRVGRVLVALGSLALVAVVLAPLTVVAVVVLLAAAVFLLGSCVQLAVALSDLAGSRTTWHRGRPGSPQAGHEPTGLPTYTVLVRLSGGEDALTEVLAHLGRLDYPRARLDAVLLVAETDAETLAAVARFSPPGWVRVARVPAMDFADPVRSHGHGLALARGRYVVSYARDEQPAPDQLRRAVAAFEADLLGRMEQASAVPPLVGLRVSQRSIARWRPLASRLDALSQASGLVPSGEGVGEVAPDFTSVHFNMRTLRRLGGFAAMASAGGTRIEHLDSTTVRAVVPGLGSWVRGCADQFETLLECGAGRSARERAVAFTAWAMCLAWPVLVAGVLVAAMRGGVVHDALPVHVVWLGIGAVVSMLALSTTVAAFALVRRRGWRASIDALLLPVQWSLAAVAAWAALVAVVRNDQAASGTDPGITVGAQPQVSLHAR